MLKKLQNNLFASKIKRGIKLSAATLAVAAFCSPSAFAQDATYTAIGAFTNTVPASQSSVTIELWGAGGNGAGIGSAQPLNSGITLAGGGGGGGGYSMIKINVIPAETYTGTVGGNTTSGNGNGTAGPASSVAGTNITGTFQAAGGGGGLTGTSGNGGNGGAGGIGFDPLTGTGADGTAGTAGIKGGNGGAGAFGGGSGGAGGINDGVTGVVGAPGVAPGGGGGGAVTNSANTSNRLGKPGGIGGSGQAKFAYSPTVLPVSLLTFIASASNNQAKLTWETASEANNNRFEVQRSSDNITYVTVATVKGSGTTSQKSTYVAYDENPENGVNYYKLVQIDNDGTTVELAIKSVNFSFAKVASVSVYPNPASDVLNVNINNIKGAKTAKASLISINGSVSFTKELQLNQGVGTYSINLNKNLAAGQYFLTISGDNLQESVKVIIK
jgi:hypothetical protein